MKESCLMKIFDGSILVGLEIIYENATNPAPDLFEREIVRIFQEHEELKKENDKLKHGIIRGKELYHNGEIEQMLLVWKHALGKE